MGQALRPELERYLSSVCPGASVVPLVGDASARRFYRLRLPAGSRIVMDYGESFRGTTDDVRMARIFEDAGLRVALVVEVSGEAGCLILEDLGDRTLEAALLDASGGTGAAQALLEGAVRLAASVARRGTPALAASERRAGPALDAERFRFEMDFFLAHYVRGVCRIEAPSAELRLQLEDLADRASLSPGSVLCHRDFHSRNLMVLDDGSLAMVDIQDARWGPDTYDLASLLRDAYADIDDLRVDSLIDLYRSLIGSTEPKATFRLRFDIVAAQRMIKALGSFGYQITTRGATRYESSIQRTVSRLRDLLPRTPPLRDLHRALDANKLL